MIIIFNKWIGRGLSCCSKNPPWIADNQQNIVVNFHQDFVARGHIFSHVRPFYERPVSDLDRSMHRSLWV